MEGRDSEIVKLLRQVIKRLDAIEGVLDLIREDLQELKSSISKRKSERKVRTRVYLRDYIDRMIYLETKDIKAKELVRRLVSRKELIMLRDDVLNVEIVTTPKVVKNIINKLPIQANEVDKVLNEREYHLLKVLNRLGYVLIRDNQYVATDLVKELIEK